MSTRKILLGLLFFPLLPSAAPTYKAFGGINAQVQSLFARALYLSPTGNPADVAQKVSRLSPSMVSGLLEIHARAPAAQTLAAVDAARRYRAAIDGVSPGIRYDVVLDMRDYASPQAVSQMMEWADSAWHPDMWTFRNAGVGPVAAAAGSYARSHAQRFGTDLAGTNLPPLMDYAILPAKGFRLSPNAVTQLRSQGVTVVARTAGPGLDSEAQALSTDAGPGAQALIKGQGNASYRVMYPLFRDVEREKELFDDYENAR